MHKPVTGALPSVVFFYFPPFARASAALATTTLFHVDPEPDKIHWNLIDQAFNAINRAAQSSVF